MNHVYVKYNEINTGVTTLTFNEIGTAVEVKKIGKGFAVLKAENLTDINNLIDAQESEIQVSQISKELFAEAVKDSETIKAIDAAVGLRIREKYTLDDELSMNYKADDNAEKVQFLEFRQEQIQIGRDQKAELGL